MTQVKDGCTASGLELVGMYRVYDEDYPTVRVGKFIICRHDATSVWVQIDGEEGFQFGDDRMEAHLQAIFDKEF